MLRVNGSLVKVDRRGLALGVAMAFSLACGNDGDAGDWSTTTPTSTAADESQSGSSTGETEGDDGPEKLDIGTDSSATQTGDDGGNDACDGPPPPADLQLSGTVYAPNGEIPISGALVYTLPGNEEIRGIPEDGVYCDECVDLPCHHYTFTNPDGSFTLDATLGDAQRFVIQKGQFLRISEIDITESSGAIDVSLTTLPDTWNPDAGTYIPKIAVAAGPYDKVHDVLGKMGMGDTTGTGELAFGEGNRSFELYGEDPMWESSLGGVVGTGLELLNDIEEMNKYHIIFIPCGSELGMIPPPPLALGEIADETRDNIREWVAAGGKLYVTDNANEYIIDSFDAYQTFFEVGGSNDLPSAYNSDGTVLDDDMLAWLEAMPPNLADIGQGEPNLSSLPQVLVEGAWSAIDEVHSVTVEDNGMDVEVGHKVWVEGPVAGGVTSSDLHPLTVTGTYGCGRLMYSNYHTGDSTHLGLNPQELLLLYLIIEIGVCAENPVPPPPVD